MRLHQPYRPLQQAQPVHIAGDGRARGSNGILPAEWAMDRLHSERAIGSIQCEKGTGQQSHAGCDGDLQDIISAQEGVLHQAWVLPDLLLLLPVPHDCCAHRRDRIEAPSSKRARLSVTAHKSTSSSKPLPSSVILTLPPNYILPLRTLRRRSLERHLAGKHPNRMTPTVRASVNPWRPRNGNPFYTSVGNHSRPTRVSLDHSSSTPPPSTWTKLLIANLSATHRCTTCHHRSPALRNGHPPGVTILRDLRAVRQKRNTLPRLASGILARQPA